MLGHVSEDHVGGDRRGLVEAGLAPLALDAVLAGEAEAAEGGKAGLGRGPRRVGRQHLAHVGLRAAVAPGLEQGRGLAHHQLGGGGLRVRTGDGKLHALVLADRAAEHDALLGVLGGAADEVARIAEALRGDQDALRVHAVDDIAEALAFPADQVLGRHLDVVEEHLAGVVVQHGIDLADVDTLSLGLAQIDQEHGEALRALPDLVRGRGAGEQQHQVGVQHPAGPHLLAVDDIAVVALLLRARLELGGIGAGGRLGDAEGLQPEFARGDARQVLALLRLAAVPEHRAHGVHLRVAGGGIARAVVDRLQHRTGGGEGQPRAAVLLGDQRREVAGLGQSLDEPGWVVPGMIELHPILVGETVADAPHTFADVSPAGIEGD